MTTSWHDALAARSDTGEPVVSVLVAQVDGSAPRGAGTWMLVDRNGLTGTIGGGRLEWDAIATAREMLDTPDGDWLRSLKEYPLGPALEQCCGGFVRLLFERLGPVEYAHLQSIHGDTGLFARPVASGTPLGFLTDRRAATALPLPAAQAARDMLSGAAEPGTTLTTVDHPNDAWLIQPFDQPGHPLFVYGAGHVGRAIIRALEGLPFAVHWVDTHDSRFPPDIPLGVRRSVAPDPATITEAAAPGTFHLVLTYSHQLDYDICLALLARNEFGFAGLIGSATKRARFFQRFRAVGIGESALARLTCPIGIEGVPGKAPAAIAISVAAQLLNRLSAADHLCGRDEYVAAQ